MTVAYPFGVDLEKARQIFGSKDKALFEKIKEDSYFINYNEQNPIEDALHDIIFNYVPDSSREPAKSKLFGLVKSKDGSGLYGNWSDYFYALLSICSVIGKDFSKNGDIFCWTNDWEKINLLLVESSSKYDLDRMSQYKKLFDTPFDDNEGCTNIYYKNEIAEFYIDFVNIENKIDEDTLGFYNEFKIALKYCKDNQLDLITFLC